MAPPAHLMKEWVSPVYTFFVAKLGIVNVNSRCAHDFKCSAHGCKAMVHRFLDTLDTRLTSNLCKHVKACCGWGSAVLSTTDQAKDANEVHTKIIKTFACEGCITAVFERKGNGKATYFNWPHTRQDMR